MPRKTRSSSRADDEREEEKPAKRKRASRENAPTASAIKEVKVAAISKEEKANVKFVGAHTSSAGGPANAVFQATEIGAKAFALFLRPQRTWNCKPLDEDKAESFRKACAEHNFSPKHIIPHGSYLMNLGSSDADLLRKSRDMFVDELKRCETLGLQLYNFHPGSTCGKMPVDECCRLVGESINKGLECTSGVTAVIENMSRQGNTIGGHFEEIRDIIAAVDDKSRVGVCLDTCHTFAAGFDIRTKEGYDKVMQEFDDIVGLKYLRALHLNDSKGKLGCHADRHENIGKGEIGLELFRAIMNDPRLNDKPLILETPMTISDAAEVKMLFEMVK